MPAAKYEAIYERLRQSIEAREYQRMLPSEHQLTALYGCSRNTIRRAIARLAEEGYVQSVHGKGVLILRRFAAEKQLLISGVESMEEAAARNHFSLRTKVIYFTELTADAQLAALTGFPEGSALYHLRRVRYLDGEAMIIDHNYFLRDVVRDLTPEIAETSVYAYVEDVLGESIVTTQRRYTVEPRTELDSKYLDLGERNCLAVVTSWTYNANGTLFEYTQSRHRPDRFVFYGLVQRKHKP
ncbi:MAG: trehalose operon repressor [Oscillibacter sp.]|nr:trehalose operon repressor [Oscillibacter sp.]